VGRLAAVPGSGAAPPGPTDAYLTLEELLHERSVPQRDCRECPRYVPDADGLDCGWCEAHDQWVKLYQAPQRWHSQCQFAFLREERPLRR
jgi:hypothetical protein